MALAYALKPKLLFLDEPTSGVSTRDKAQIMDTIASVVRGEGITAVIVEHDMDVVFKYSDRIVVMAQGAILAQGTPDEIRNNEQVAMTLLGASDTRRIRTKGLTPCSRSRRSTPTAAPRTSCTACRSASGASEVVCLVGRNGAGKTTTIDSIMGFLPLRAGEITFDGENINRLPPHERARRGIGYSPENCGVFPELSVGENLMISRWLGDDGRQAAWRARAPIPRSRRSASSRRSRTLLARQGLHLSGGQRKMVAVARAMMLSPSLLLLDEAFEGLAPVIVSRFTEAVMKIKALGVSILMAESHLACGDPHRRPALCHRPRRDHLPGAAEGCADRRERDEGAARLRARRQSRSFA